MTYPFTLRDGRSYQLVKHPRFTGAAESAAAASPWGIRMVAPNGKRGWHSLHTTAAKEAIRRAKDLLDTAAAGPDAWTTHAEINHRRAGITFAPIIDAYLAAGCPRKVEIQWIPRTGRSLVDERRYLDTARPWWAAKPAGHPVHESTLNEYLAHRGHAARSVELEKNALSNACRYAIGLKKLTENPFSGLGNIRAKGSVTHCHAEMPANADELHALCRYLLSSPTTAPYGAHLLLQAFTGLRPGEPGYLLLEPAPGQPGSTYRRTVEDRIEERMVVVRCKLGINPAVRLHAALSDFLGVWKPYVREHYPGAIHLVPHPHAPHDRPAVPAGNSQASYLDKQLKRAAAALGIAGNRRPHAMRAYCGAVLLDQGRTAGEVAMALGEKTGEKMILSTYGDPGQHHGIGKYTWLPSGAPCWEVLSQSTPTNVIPMELAEGEGFDPPVGLPLRLISRHQHIR